MGIKNLLLVAVSAILVVGAGLSPQPTPTATGAPVPTPTVASPPALLSTNWPPIIDMHGHAQPSVTAEAMIGNMDAANVPMMVIMPNGGYRFDAALALQQANPDRFLAFLGFLNAGWIQQRPGFLVVVEEQLRTGQFKGLGEVLLLHYAIPQRGAPHISIPADSPAALRALDLAAEYQVPIVIHMEAEDETLKQLARALEQKREPAVIWAHAGRATADTVDRFLAAYPNLYIDLAALSRAHRYGAERNPISDPQGVLTPEWKALLIKYQDRVLAGSDTPFPDLWGSFYVRAIQGVRALIQQLPEEVAEKIAFRNAARLLNLQFP